MSCDSISDWHVFWVLLTYSLINENWFIHLSIYSFISGSHPHSEAIWQVPTWIGSWTFLHHFHSPHLDHGLARCSSLPWFFRSSMNSKTSACHGSRYIANDPLPQSDVSIFSGSAVRVWGMWYDWFFHHHSWPPIKCLLHSKKNRKSSLSYAAFWGTFAPTLFHEACRLVEVPQHWNQPVAAAIAATNVGSRGLRNRSIWFRQEIDWIW